jgi:hypothetical protein
MSSGHPAWNLNCLSRREANITRCQRCDKHTWTDSTAPRSMRQHRSRLLTVYSLVLVQPPMSYGEQASKRMMARLEQVTSPQLTTRESPGRCCLIQQGFLLYQSAFLRSTSSRHMSLRFLLSCSATDQVYSTPSESNFRTSGMMLGNSDAQLLSPRVLTHLRCGGLRGIREPAQTWSAHDPLL